MNLDNIVFDTSALMSENFPDLSAAFRQLSEFAETLEIKLYIPDIVLQELQQKFIDRTFDSINKIRGEHKKLKKFVQEKINIVLPEMDALALAYKQQVESLILNKKFIRIPMPSIAARDLIDKAVRRVPPFEVGDRGFRDAMIIESIIEYGLNNNIKGFIFVSNDKIFENQEIFILAKEKGISLEIPKTVDEINKNIFKLLSKVQKRLVKEREKRAIDFLNTKRDEIDQYLRTNLELAKDDIPAGYMCSPIAVLSAKLIHIPDAVLEEKEDKKIAISFTADVEVNVLVRSLGFGVKNDQQRTYKIGENFEVESAFGLMNDSFFMQPAVNKNITIKTKGEVEVEKVGSEHKNFRIIFIRPQPKFSGGLLSSFLQNAE